MKVFKSFLLSCILLNLFEEGSTQVKSIQNAFIYASQRKEGAKIEYAVDTDWSDLNSILNQNGFMDIGTLCVYGPWIMYRLVKYDAKGPQHYSIVSGANNCVHPGSIGSMQPLGSADAPFIGSVTFFTQPHFASPAVAITSRRGKSFFDNFQAPIKSFIIVGRSQWTVLDNKGISYCLATNFDPLERLPICLVSDLALYPFTKGFQISGIHKGCRQDVKAEKVMILEDCSYFGERKIDLNDKLGSDSNDKDTNLKPLNNEDDPTLRAKRMSQSMGGGGGGGGGGNNNETYNKQCPPDEETKEFINLLTIRLNHDFGSEIQLDWPGLGENIWKTVILDLTWDIAMKIIPDLVPQDYLLLMREFMIYHISLQWKQSKDNKKELFPESVTDVLIADLENCNNMMDEHGDGFIESNLKAWYKDEPIRIFNKFKRNPSMDIIVDTTYLVANMVLGACHHLFDFSNNFWANYIHIFNRMYLIPLIEDWKTMRIEDQYLLGGYDYESQYQRMAIFATEQIELIPNFEPFERPKELRPREDNQEFSKFNGQGMSKQFPQADYNDNLIK